MSRVTEFSFKHDDFALDGLFAICDKLLIEVEVNIHGEFSVSDVDRMDRGFAFPVPTVIFDYVTAWALTATGKATIREAYHEECRQSSPEDEIAAIRADDRHDQRMNAA